MHMWREASANKSAEECVYVHCEKKRWSLVLCQLLQL